MYDRPFLVVREQPRPGRPHAYDVVLDWIAENFPEQLPLFRLASLPYDLGEDDFSLHVAWLRDPVEAYSGELYDHATRLAAQCDRLGIPVINRVDRLINATKLRGAGLMAEAGIRVPRMARVTSAEEFHDTLCGIPLPLILRDDWGHQGELLRADTMEEARALPLDRFLRPIAVELVDTRDARDGYYRKYRYFAIGEQGVTSHLQISRDWITRGEARVRGDNARFEELDYIGRPDPNHAALQQARRALGLDYVAFDYGYDAEGRVVVWEGNPYPYLHFSTQTLVYRNASMHRTLAGILKLYLERAGMPSTERLDSLLDYGQAPSTTWTRLGPAPVVLRERAPARAMWCVGEFALTLGHGDGITLELASAKDGEIVGLARRDFGQGTPLAVSPLPSDGTTGRWSLATDAVGPAVITILADRAVAPDVADTIALIHTSGRKSPRLDGTAARTSRLQLAPALVVARGQRVDQFRIRSTLKETLRYCLAAVSLDGARLEKPGYSSGLKTAFRYLDVTGGATLIANPFADAGDYVVFLVPWSPGDRREQIAAITGFDGFEITRVVGDAATTEVGTDQTASVEISSPESQVLWTLDEAFETHVKRLVDVARTTASGEIRQQAVDRLVAINRCPDDLISRPGGRARAASSFRRALLTWSRKAELQRSNLGLEKALEWRAKDEDHGYRLARALGADVLDRHGPLSASAALERAAAASNPVVIKPLGAANSRGVYVVHGPDSILDLGQRQWIANLDTLAAVMAQLQWHEWLVEDFAAKPGDPFSPAPDLKFYAFYGRLGLILEVERYPMQRYAFWLPDGSRTATGHYANQFFEGSGFTQDQLHNVERISSQLPFPFMRIDFLRGEAGFFFREFTPRPSDFDAFNPSSDERLGDLWLDGELRLTRDLLVGKQFAVFTEWAAPFLPGGDGT